MNIRSLYLNMERNDNYDDMINEVCKGVYACLIIHINAYAMYVISTIYGGEYHIYNSIYIVLFSKKNKYSQIPVNN